MENELPKGWLLAQPFDIAEKIRGVSYNTNEISHSVGKGLIPVMRANNIEDNKLNYKDLVYVPERSINRNQLLQAGDVVIAMSSGSKNLVGKTAQYFDTIEISFGAFCAALRPSKEIDRKYFGYYFQGREYRNTISELSAGTSINNLKNEHFEALRIPLPPLAEQRRIVAKLDAVMEKVEANKRRLDKIPQLLKRFRQSVLAAAVSGRLTEEWRSHNIPSSGWSLLKKLQGDHNSIGGHRKGNSAPPTEGVHVLTPDQVPKNWAIAEMRDLCAPDSPITYGILKPGPEIDNGIPYIRVADFPNDSLSTKNIRKTSKVIDASFSRSRLMTNDLLLSIRGTVGRVCLIPAELNGANITQDSARLRIHEGVSFRYVAIALRSQILQRPMSLATKGVAIRGINIGDVRALQVPLPPRDEQEAIVEQVNQLFAFADKLETRYAKAKAMMDKLPQSILAKAFRGELVAQDPKDEAAGVLLERIRAEKAELTQQKKVRKPNETVKEKGKSKVKAKATQLG